MDQSDPDRASGRAELPAIEELQDAMGVDESRYVGVTSLDDEHIWHHVSTEPIDAGGLEPKELAGMVDLTTRLDAFVPGSSTSSRAARVRPLRRLAHRACGGLQKGREGRRTRPIPGPQDRINDQLQDAVAVLDAYIVKLGTAPVDERRRRVQQETLGHRGRNGDPLGAIAMLLRAGAEKVLQRKA